MKLKISLDDYSVEELQVKDFSEVPEVENNGQHWQLPGYVLAEVGLAPNHSFHFFHPETKPTETGHIDVIVSFKENNVTFRRYSHSLPISLYGEDLEYLWPSGSWNLLMVTDAIEMYLKKSPNGGYSPLLRNWILRKIAGFK